jgi:hypothetical protein
MIAFVPLSQILRVLYFRLQFSERSPHQRRMKTGKPATVAVPTSQALRRSELTSRKTHDLVSPRANEPSTFSSIAITIVTPGEVGPSYRILVPSGNDPINQTATRSTGLLQLAAFSFRMEQLRGQFLVAQTSKSNAKILLSFIFAA